MDSQATKPEKKNTPESDSPFLPSWLKNTSSFLWETFKVVIIALAIIYPIRHFVVQPFYVRGASMEPTFHDFQYLLIDEISYRFSEPKRGDIVVFKYPEDPSQYFIKRLIGLPGETIDVQDGRVVISPENPGAPEILLEPYIAESIETGCVRSYHCVLPITLGQDEFFVLGDNRTASLDSRYFGSVPRNDLIGKAWVRVWPFSSFTIFTSQNMISSPLAFATL